ncbi:unnamed protein product [Symbiodinium microadriaticum]|nr:unnamed protein product [Symbiodinium microadriaticum]
MNDGSHAKPAHIEIRDMLGGTYGEFMSLLLLKRETINIDLLDVAFKSIGCDECLIADVLCACSYVEMTETHAHFDTNRDTPLQEMLRTKSLEKSSFQRFVHTILSTKRNDEDVFDDVDARAQMEELHNALSKTFAGSAQRALLLWISPLLASIASLFYLSLHSTVVDFDLTCHLATKYNKKSLQEAVVVYKTLYKEDLVEQLGKKLTGNFKKSVIAWLTSPTYDGGAESSIEEMVNECSGDMVKLLADPVRLNRLRELVQEENTACRQRVQALEAEDQAAAAKKQPPLPTKKKDAPAPGPIPDNTEKESVTDPGLAVLSRASSTIGAADTKDSHAGDSAAAVTAALEADSAADEGDANTMFSSPSKRNELGYEDKFKLICEYLLERFKQDDLDDSGTLDSGEFWTTLKHLKVGYTDEELSAIEQWVDYDGASGRTVEDKVVELWEENRLELEALWSEYNDWQLTQEGMGEESLSPSLIQYLKDSFDAFDVDKNGSLNNDEFWHILTTVLGLTEGDKALMQIGLVDKASGNLFWYNLRDETSFWMTEADQEAYRAFLAGETDGNRKLAPETVPSALSTKSKSFKDGNIKALREFKSVKKGLGENVKD